MIGNNVQRFNDARQSPVKQIAPLAEARAANENDE